MKRWIAILAALALLTTAAGCAKTRPRVDPATTGAAQQAQRPTGDTQQTLPTEPNGGWQPGGLSLSVNQSTGQMTIVRPEQEDEQSMGAKDTWTVLLYICGSDLESDYGLASGDLEELLAASASDKVRFVVQTGGASAWANSSINASRTQRFLAENGRLREVDSQRVMNMGAKETLEDFLCWGVTNYPAAKMGVIFWDHGGGGINGVCFDEQYYWDSLSLRELDAAFLSAFGKMTDKFEFVGFDACLMGTVETANVLASYARYMIAAEETEPGYGWDYKAVGDYLAEHPEADGAALGRVACDSFLASCKAVGDWQNATLSVVDLSRVDALLRALNSFTESMYAQSEDLSTRSAMVRQIVAAENFGGNNKAEGYTNMVDLGGIVDACADYASGGREVWNALKDAVIYKVAGPDHAAACGLSTYYPLEIQGSMELSIFADLCVSPYYLAFIDRLGQGGVDVEYAESYDDDIWFDDGEWYWSEEDEDDGDDYWNYVDEITITGESPLITFDIEPTLDLDDGTYYFMLDESGMQYTADVYAMVGEFSEDGEDIIVLGQTYDIRVEWDYGYVEDWFDGYWLSLPDGQNLALYIADVTEEYIVYTSPIRLNGEDTNLRIRQSYSGGAVIVDGTWAGIDEYGASARTVTELKRGDVILPRYEAFAIDTDWEGTYVGWEYVLDSDTLEIGYELMDPGDYYYTFRIDDIYGDYRVADGALFSVKSDGTVTFYYF